MYYCDKACLAKDWKDGGHKIVCKNLREAIEQTEPLIDTTTTPPNGTDIFGTVESRQERRAQDLCYDAMEARHLPKKVNLLIKALKVFPLSTEAWGMLGAYYRHDLPEGQRDYEKSVRMYENSMRCARKLNPEWTEDREEKLEWGYIEHRPYLRSVLGLALSLKELGRTGEAIAVAKKLLRWNPGDNQGVRTILCNWLLEAGDTEACLNLVMDYQTDGRNYDSSLSYSYLLLQFLRWKRGDALEEAVQKALCAALDSNPYVPDLLLKKDPIEKLELQYLDSGGPKEAISYVVDAQGTWRAHAGALVWLADQRSSQNDATPADWQLVRLLRSEMVLLVYCKHTALDGTGQSTSWIRVTQRKDKCFGCAVPDFVWPAELDREYSSGQPIIMYWNEFGQDMRSRWRKTCQADIIEVPFWKVLIQGADAGWFKENNLPEEEEEASMDDESHFRGLSEADRLMLQAAKKIETNDDPEMVEAAPKSFICPLSLEIMREPVILVATGSTYERYMISQWFLKEDSQQNELIDPSTKKPIETAQLIDNRALRNTIEDWRKEWECRKA